MVVVATTLVTEPRSKKRSRCDGWRVRFVSALAEGSQCDQSRLKCHSHRSRRKKPAPQWLPARCQSGNENFVLMLKSVLQRRAWLGAVQCGDAFLETSLALPRFIADERSTGKGSPLSMGQLNIRILLTATFSPQPVSSVEGKSPPRILCFNRVAAGGAYGATACTPLLEFLE